MDSHLSEPSQPTQHWSDLEWAQDEGVWDTAQGGRKRGTPKALASAAPSPAPPITPLKPSSTNPPSTPSPLAPGKSPRQAPAAPALPYPPSDQLREAVLAILAGGRTLSVEQVKGELSRVGFKLGPLFFPPELTKALQAIPNISRNASNGKFSLGGVVGGAGGPPLVKHQHQHQQQAVKVLAASSPSAPVSAPAPALAAPALAPALPPPSPLHPPTSTFQPKDITHQPGFVEGTLGVLQAINRPLQPFMLYNLLEPHLSSGSTGGGGGVGGEFDETYFVQRVCQLVPGVVAEYDETGGVLLSIYEVEGGGLGLGMGTGVGGGGEGGGDGVFGEEEDDYDEQEEFFVERVAQDPCATLYLSSPPSQPPPTTAGAAMAPPTQPSSSSSSSSSSRPPHRPAPTTSSSSSSSSTTRPSPSSHPHPPHPPPTTDFTPQDWRCPSCGHFNFSAAAGSSGTGAGAQGKKNCLKCVTPRPSVGYKAPPFTRLCVSHDGAATIEQMSVWFSAYGKLKHPPNGPPHKTSYSFLEFHDPAHALAAQIGETGRKLPGGRLLVCMPAAQRTGGGGEDGGGGGGGGGKGGKAGGKARRG